MVKHVILWKLDESRTAEQKAEIKKNMKLHVAAADTYVRPYTVQRVCMDYEI